MSSAPTISAAGLRKRYGSTQALDGFDLEVAAGSIHGLLGPNGAGKSTVVRILSTLASLDEGAATVAGYDLRSQPHLIHRSIGLVGQSAAVDEILGGQQNLVMFGRLCGLGKTDATARAEHLLDSFSLSEAGRKAVSTYSGGMRRRLDIAASLILTPAVLFLDEPTTGLDPRGRNEVWATVRRVAASGTTVLLTTQYLDEADQLADRITVMDNGRVIAEGTPDALKTQIGGDRVVVTLPPGIPLAGTAAMLGDALGTTASTDAETATVTVEAPSGTVTLLAVVRALDANGIAVEDVALRRPSLDDVFLTLTDKEHTR